jgi:16S rRNA A1518/A1519 N6-dimethyltransferase RsmA/KsgA/DIM1 with predicted DNA glycosylase/AP lyase activity
MQLPLPKIPYFETSRYRVQAMIDLAKIQCGDKVADLGAGDGRITIAFAQAGAIVTAYEIEESFIRTMEKNIQDERLLGKITIANKNFWEEDLSTFSIIAIYPMPDIMEALEVKLQSETKPGTRILTNYYSFPLWKETTHRDNIYLYTR